MFLWLELDLATHPQWSRMLAEADSLVNGVAGPTAPTLDTAPAVIGQESLAEDAAQEDVDDPSLPPASRLCRLIWLEMLQAGVLLVPGSYYEPWTGGKEVKSAEDKDREMTKGREAKGHVRLAFSFNSVSDTQSVIGA